MKKQKNFTLEQIQKYNDRYYNMKRRCMDQFISNLKTYFKEHPELNGKIHFDPDHCISAVYESKHCSYSGDVVAASIDAKGYVKLDFSNEYFLDKDLYLTEDACYGIYIDDWPWALQVLLETFKNPYTPDEDNEDDEDDDM